MQMIKDQNFKRGRLGEKLAGEHLKKKGYKIIEQNFSTRFGEIDLIAIKRKKLVFVEVKLKIGDKFGSPEEMITSGKVRQVQRTAQTYLLKEKKISEKFSDYQIDAVCIVLDEDDKSVDRIEHYENIGADI